MNIYNVDTSESNLRGPLVSLDILYEGMPKTSGCDTCEDVNGKNGKDWCCLSGKTLVYTNCGPIPIEELNLGDTVFTKSGLKKVKKIGKKLVKKDLVYFETRYGRQCLLTSDHRIFAGFGRHRSDNEQSISDPIFVESKDLLKKTHSQHGHYVVFPKIHLDNQEPDIHILVNEYVEDIFIDEQLCFASKRKTGKSLPVNLKVDSDFLFILGLFLAEGSISKASVDFHLNCSEKYLVDKIVRFAESYGLHCSHKNNRGDSCTHRICSTVMSRLFEKLCGKLCDKKKINRKLFRSIIPFRMFLAAIHDGYYAGDGVKSGNYSYTTTSYRLHSQMIFINMVLGRICCSTYSAREGKKKCWTGSYSISPKYRDYIEKEYHYLVPIRKVSQQYYEGYVYDIEIEDEESFYTEAGEVHNCKMQTPSMFYAEFLKVFQVYQKWNKQKRSKVVLRAVRNYLDNKLDKGCIFYAGGCQVYERRPFVCFVGETIVLTDEGPKCIKEITAGDRVMTHKGRYKKVLRTTSTVCEDDYMRWVMTKSDLGVTCTSDHRFYTVFAKDKRSSFVSKLHWRRAVDLEEKRIHQSGNYTCFPKIVFGHGLSKICVSDYLECKHFDDQHVLSICHNNTPSGRTPSPIPKEFDVDKEFLWMLGLYLAEGSCSNSGASFSLHKKEKSSFGKRLANYFSNLNISWSESVRKNSYVFHVNSSVFAKLIKKLCGNLCYNKVLHPNLFQLTCGQLLEIFYGWNDGDGNHNSSNGCKWRAVTTSRILIYQMSFILRANGLHPFLFVEKRSNREYLNYSIAIYDADFHNKSGQGNCYKEEGDMSFFPIKMSITLPNREKECVFDIEVEDDESFVTSAGIVHNCRIYGVISEKTWSKRWKLLKERQGNEFCAKPQCSLVSADREITSDMEDKWFTHTKKCETRIGVSEGKLHDNSGGSYRTFHDHLLLELFGEDVLSFLTKVRITNPSREDIDLTVEEMRTLIDQLSKG